MLNHLESLFTELRKHIWDGAYRKVTIVGANPKGHDVSAGFDLEAERFVADYCRRHEIPVRILSEESGAIEISPKPKWLLVIDPVDGSTNMKRGIEGTAFSAAVLEYRGNDSLIPNDVVYALIGSLTSGATCYAQKNKGSFYKGPYSGWKKVRCHSSDKKDLGIAMVEIDLDFGLDESKSVHDIKEGSKIRRILPLLYPVRNVKHVRRGGAAAQALMNVATGAVESYIDVRDILTPENWIAAHLLINEAGGVMTDIFGKPVSAVTLTQPLSIVASGNKTIHKRILQNIDARV